MTSDDLINWFENKIGDIDIEDFEDFTGDDIQEALYRFGINESSPAYRDRAESQLTSPILNDTGGVASSIFGSEKLKRKITDEIKIEQLRHLFRTQRRLWNDIRADIRSRGGSIVVASLTDTEVLDDYRKKIIQKKGSNYFLTTRELENEIRERGLVEPFV